MIIASISRPGRRYWLFFAGSIALPVALGGLWLANSETIQPKTVQAFAPPAIDALVNTAMKSWHVPGVALGIVQNDKVLYLKGYGIRQLGHPEQVTPKTIFPLASCTKAFTTMALAMLADEGKIRWDDPVRQHVAYFHLADPTANADVRIEDLITHRTGLGSNEFLWYRSPWDQREIIRRVGLVPLEHPIRTAFRYQSTMFNVAGCAIESAAKSSWSEFIQRRIAIPLGLKDIHYTAPDPDQFPNQALPHRLNANGAVEAVLVPYVLNRPDPAGSIHACAEDLCQWVRFQLGDGALDGKRLISRENLEIQHQPHMVIPRAGAAEWMNPETVQLAYGYGWVVQDYRGHRQVSHAGYIDGFRVHITLMPDDHLGIVLLNNLQDTLMNLALSNSLVDSVLGFPGRDWNVELQREASSHNRTVPNSYVMAVPSNITPRDLAGSYDSVAYGPSTVTEKKGVLRWSWHQFNGTLHPIGGNVFYLENEWMHNPIVCFIFSPAGRATGLRLLDPVDVSFSRSTASSATSTR